ncbi:MAG: hypothetical protein HC942_27115 [Microcoleus sp. SU_5_6]|nr:hypothetical protein [Microcoleus sp. SU_5_6]
MLQIYRNGANGEIIRGRGLPAFIHNGNYYQTIIGVFEDGTIDCWELVDFEEFTNKVTEGWVVTQVPKGARISCHHLYYGNSNLECYIEIDEFVKEVEDTINQLQGKQTARQTCFQAFARFLTEPNKKTKLSCGKLTMLFPNIVEFMCLAIWIVKIPLSNYVLKTKRFPQKL